MEGKAKFNNGSTALTNTLHTMIKGMTDKPPQLDFGIILSNYALKINTFAQPIPLEEYSVCRQLLYDPSVPLTETYRDGGHTHENQVPYETHKHQVKLPKKMRRLKPGDKVLVAIITNEFVVIDIVYNATYLKGAEPVWT